MIGIVLAGVGTVACFLGDWFNNTIAIVDANAVRDWVGIVANSGMVAVAFGFALAVPLIGFYVGQRRKYYLGLAVAVVCSCGLTVFGRYTHMETKEVRAAAQVEYKRSLLQEAANLNESLYPTDGSVPCKHQRWCISAEKEARLAEISAELREISETGITGTPGDHKEAMQYGLLGIMGLGLPIVSGTLSGLCGFLCSTRRQKKRQAKSANEWDSGSDHDDKITPIDWYKKKLTGIRTGLKKRLKKRFSNQSNDPRTGKPETGTGETGPDSRLNYYQEAVKLVRNGVKPSTNALKQAGLRGRREDVQAYLRMMANEGLLIPPKKNGGRYRVSEGAFENMATG